MAALRVGRKSFERRHRSNTSALLKLASGLPERPSAGQIHDLRVSIRRLQTARRLLPKELREFPDSKRFDLALKSTMRATSQLRDLDTLIETLEPHRRRLPEGTMLNLQNQRSDFAATSGEAAASLAQIPVPRLYASQIGGRKISKRLRKKARVQRRITRDLVKEVVNDESKVAELHSLRKEIKKLRYLLELADRSPSEVVALTKWQESLGAVHDLDVAVLYLGAKGPEFGKAVRELRRIRHARYLGFVKDLLGSRESQNKRGISASSPSPQS
jgi:CHAD domain-containing protein